MVSDPTRKQRLFPTSTAGKFSLIFFLLAWVAFGIFGKNVFLLVSTISFFTGLAGLIMDENRFLIALVVIVDLLSWIGP